MLELLVAYLVPIISGVLLVSFFCRGALVHTWLGLSFFVGIGCGLGVSSLLYFGFLVLRGFSGGLVSLEICLLLGLLLAGWTSGAWRRLKHAVDLPLSKECYWGYATLFALSLVVACCRIYFAHVQSPLGGWDAVAVWNLRARFLYLGEESWADLFGLKAYHMPDYPLLLPGAVARVWTLVGEDYRWVPFSISIFFTVATVGQLVFALMRFVSPREAWLGGFVLLVTVHFSSFGAGQVADVPVGYFLLGSLIFHYAGMRESRRSLFVLSGFLVSLAAWTKNEGLLFLTAICASRAALGFFKGFDRRFCKEMAAFLLGALPVVAVVLTFKAYATQRIESSFPLELLPTLDKALDFTRWEMILRTGWKEMFLTGAGIVPALFTYVLVSGIRRNRNDHEASGVLALTLFFIGCGFFLIYLGSPHDLMPYMEASVSRLLMQVWPSLIFLAMLLTGPSQNRSPFHEEEREGRATLWTGHGDVD